MKQATRAVSTPTVYNVVTVLRYGDYLLLGFIVKSLALCSRPSASRAGGGGVRTDTHAP